MPIDVLWGLPPRDGRFSWEPDGRWLSDFNYYKQLAGAIDRLPFSGALMAIGVPGAFDPWTVASALIPYTERMKFMLAIYPGVVKPTQMALMAQTFDQLSNGRLMINAVGGQVSTMAAQGIHLGDEEKYSMYEEYWRQVLDLYAGKPTTGGEYFPLSEAHLVASVAGVQRPHPLVWGTAESAPGLRAVARIVDTYAMSGGTPDEVAAKVARAKEAAAQVGRTLRYAFSVGIIARETEEEAWAEAARRLRHTRPETIRSMAGWKANKAAGLEGADERELRALSAIENDRMPAARDLEFYPNLWTGPNDVLGIDVRRVAKGPNMAFVGSGKQIAERMREYQEVAGVDQFIVSSPPFIEEAYHVAENLIPHLDLYPPSMRAAPPPAPLFVERDDFRHGSIDTHTRG